MSFQQFPSDPFIPQSTFPNSYTNNPLIPSAYYDENAFPNAYTNNHLAPYPNYPAWTNPHGFPGNVQGSLAVPTTCPDIAQPDYDAPQATSYWLNGYNPYPTLSSPSFADSVSPILQEQVIWITKTKVNRVKHTRQTKPTRMELAYVMEELPSVTPGMRTQIIKIWPEPQGRKAHIGCDVVPVSAIHTPAIYNEPEIPRSSRRVFITPQRIVGGLVVDARFRDKVEELVRGYDADNEALKRKLKSLPSPWFDSREPIILLRCPSPTLYHQLSVPLSESAPAVTNDLRALRENVVNFSDLNKDVWPENIDDSAAASATLEFEDASHQSWQSLFPADSALKENVVNFSNLNKDVCPEQVADSAAALTAATHEVEDVGHQAWRVSFPAERALKETVANLNRDVCPEKAADPCWSAAVELEDASHQSWQPSFPAESTLKENVVDFSNLIKDVCPENVDDSVAALASATYDLDDTSHQSGQPSFPAEKALRGNVVNFSNLNEDVRPEKADDPYWSAAVELEDASHQSWQPPFPAVSPEEELAELEQAYFKDFI